jgi:ATP-dependent DNA ligase
MILDIHTHSHSPRLVCENAERPPEGHEWRYELKLDGFRAIGRKSGRSAAALVAHAERFHPPVYRCRSGTAELPRDTVLDGEIEALSMNTANVI